MLNAFFQGAGVNNVNANETDFCQVSLKYDKVTQLTYAQESGDWLLGYKSYSVCIVRTTELTQFVVGSSGHQETTYQYATSTV